MEKQEGEIAHSPIVPSLRNPGNAKKFEFAMHTIRKHVDNLWLLGGEIIRDLNDAPALRKVTADRLLRDAVHADGGPLIHNGDEETQRSFDSTCRKLHRFLTQPQR